MSECMRMRVFGMMRRKLVVGRMIFIVKEVMRRVVLKRFRSCYLKSGKVKLYGSIYVLCLVYVSGFGLFC